MSTGKLLGYALGAPIYLAKQVNIKGTTVAVRLVDSVDTAQVTEAGSRVTEAMEGDKLLTADMKQKVMQAEVTSMPHQSPMDPETHYTVKFSFKDGSTGTGHVTVDPDKQQVAR